MDPLTPSRSSSRRFPEISPLSRAPSRRQQFTENEINPLLSNLSPASTLEALVATDAVPTEKEHRQSFIQESVALASSSERAWGIKAALAGKKLREWHQELLLWPWPGYEARDCEGEEVWGGLPAKTVQQYEERLEIITDDMETLEVDDLKDYVRSRHLGSQLRVSLDAMAPSNYQPLSDFSAIITAIIVQALPALSHLATLLNIWTIRFSVLRQVPAFLRNLADSKESMLSAWIAVGKPESPTGKWRSNFSRQSFLSVQAVLKDQIAQLGRMLDNMLDLLEGSRDALPEKWIDAIDALESEYGLWVVKAEELLLENEINPSQVGQNSRARIADSGSNCEFNQLSSAQGEFGATRIHSVSPAVIQQNISRDDNLNGDRPIDLDHDIQNSPVDHGAGIEDEAMTSPLLEQDRPRSIQGRSMPGKSKVVHRPASLVLAHDIQSAENIVSSNMSSEMSDPGSATSDYFSDKSSPEIRNASVVEYVSSPALVSSPWSSKEIILPSDVASCRSSLQTERVSRSPQLDGTLSLPNQPSHTPIDSSDGLPSSGVVLVDGRLEEPPSSISHVRTRSASMQSIEVIPKSEIRKITIGRSESYTSTLPDIKRMALQGKSEPEATPINSKPEVRSEPTGEPSDCRTQNIDKLPRSEIAKDFQKSFNFPSLDAKPPAPPKVSHRFQEISDLGPGQSPVKIRHQKVTSAVSDKDRGPESEFQAPTKALPMHPDDRLEAQISSILTQIPAHIRLTSESNPEALESDYFNSTPPRHVGRPSPVRQMNRAQTSVTTPIMTLAASQPKSSKPRSSNAEPEIKLYHLHQPGKDVPIKLFVRLVGDAGERVMVRIGGGWADLAEYLKEYASHHGRRSVSDTRFNIQGIPSSPASQASPVGRPASPISSKPSPAMSFKRQQTTPGKFESPHTPASDPSARPSSRMSWTEEDSPSPSLGLAGPTTKKIEISPRRQAWVDEMMEQAKGSNGGPSMGNIGKVGGTKRMFLKGRSRAGSNV